MTLTPEQRAFFQQAIDMRLSVGADSVQMLFTAHDALAARVRELDEQVNTLLNKNGDRIVASLLRTCLRCRRPFERESDIYRCVDCDAELHKDCAIQHFGQRVWPPTQACAVDAALREERSENQQLQQALKSAETLKARAEEEKDALAARVQELEAEREAHITTGGQLVGQVRALREALSRASNSLRTVGDDYPGSSCHDYCHRAADDADTVLLAAKTATRPPEAPEEGVCTTQAPNREARAHPDAVCVDDGGWAQEREQYECPNCKVRFSVGIPQ